MTIEQILLSGIGSVTLALVYVSKLLWARSVECEHDRIILRNELSELKQALGIAQGELRAFARCPERNCPFQQTPKQ